MTAQIRSVAVLGAGTMGAQIAAHAANAGVPTHLLDLTEAVAQEGLKRAAALKPDPFFTRDAATLITTGGFDHHLDRLTEVDWIIEAVVEQIDIKRSLLERVDRVRRPGAIVSSNTSGIPIGALAEGLGDEFKRHWLGTHFFNPPRYLRLLEVIPTSATDPAVVDRISQFADHQPRQRRRRRQGHAQFHRQSNRALRRRPDVPRARKRRVHHRRDRRHHRAGHRAAEERHVPHDGHRRPRCARASREKSRRPAA